MSKVHQGSPCFWGIKPTSAEKTHFATNRLGFGDVGSYEVRGFGEVILNFAVENPNFAEENPNFAAV